MAKTESTEVVEVRVKNEVDVNIMERAQWGGKLEFILTCIGAGVGLGNVWRFPYLLYKSGGGAFLIPFTIMLFIIGIPIFMLEISLGQFSSLSPIQVFKISPILKGMSYTMVITEWLVSLYYCVIISWCIYYFFCSFSTNLPWESCSYPWNTIYCAETEELKNLTKLDGNWVVRNGVNMSRQEIKTCSEEFFYRKVLQMSDGIDSTGQVVWQIALCLLLAWIIVFLVLSKGIQTLGKVVYFTSTFPYILLTIMLVMGVLLPGSSKGIEFYMIPDWSKLKDPSVWSGAATQVFYSLSSCTGALIAMSSYNQFHNNTIRDSILVPICNFLTSIYAGFVIFSVLGYMAEMKGVEVSDVAADGPGLVFVVYPEALSLMPLPQLWNALFFFMMIILGLSSMFSMSESFFTSFSDEFPNLFRSSRNRIYIVRAVGIFCFYLLSFPMITNGGFYWFTLVDFYVGGYPLLVLAVLEIALISYIYGHQRYVEDIKMMVGDRNIILNFFRVAWVFITPVFIMLSIIASIMSYSIPTLFDDAYVFPYWSEVVGWILVTFVLMFIPGYFFLYIAVDLWKIIKAGFQPEDDWGPYDNKDRTGRYAPKVESERKEVEADDYNVINSNNKNYSYQINYGFSPYVHNQTSF